MTDIHDNLPEPTMLTFMRSIRETSASPIFVSRNQVIEILDYVDHVVAQRDHLFEEKMRLIRPKAER